MILQRLIKIYRALIVLAGHDKNWVKPKESFKKIIVSFVALYLLRVVAYGITGLTVFSMISDPLHLSYKFELYYRKAIEMISPQMPRNIQFRVETMFANNNNRVGRIKPDDNGIYKGLPLMVLGQITQQGTYYDPQSVMDQITNPKSRLNMIYRQNKLYGEYGHPSFYGMSDNDKIERLHTVDERNRSHLFTGLYTDKPSADQTVVLRGDIKPCGPMGGHFKEELDDPILNPAFSLRAYVTTDVRPDGVRFRKIRQLTTWDTVGPSGYATTDKANAIGLESFSGDNFLEYEINIMADGNLMIDQIALERFENTDINEIFGMSSISQIVQSRTIIQPNKELQEKFPGLYQSAIFNDYFREVK